MKRQVLDTSVLIHHWRRRSAGHLGISTVRDARRWARDLIQIEVTDAIVSPVALEVLYGTRDAHELKLSVAYVEEFRLADDGAVTVEDWEEARRLAVRVPRDGRPRQLGDCLIRAIVNRLRLRVKTFDTGMPR
jgi:predicted nucleic acid-binding protein